MAWFKTMTWIPLPCSRASSSRTCKWINDENHMPRPLLIPLFCAAEPPNERQISLALLTAVMGARVEVLEEFLASHLNCSHHCCLWLHPFSSVHPLLTGQPAPVTHRCPIHSHIDLRPAGVHLDIQDLLVDRVPGDLHIQHLVIYGREFPVSTSQGTSNSSLLCANSSRRVCPAGTPAKESWAGTYRDSRYGEITNDNGSDPTEISAAKCATAFGRQTRKGS